MTNENEEFGSEEVLGGKEHGLAMLPAEQPHPIVEVMRLVSPTGNLPGLAKYMWETGLCESAGAEKPQDVVALLMFGYRFNWDPFQIVQNCCIVRGRISMYASVMQALAQEKAGVRFEIAESGQDGQDGKVGEWCEIKAVREGYPEVKVRFTMEQAKRAGLVKERSNWEKWGPDMLYSKAMSRACRRIAPEVLTGVYTPEEVRTIPVEEKAPKLQVSMAEVKAADPAGLEERKRQEPEKPKRTQEKTATIVRPRTGPQVAAGVGEDSDDLGPAPAEQAVKPVESEAAQPNQTWKEPLAAFVADPTPVSEEEKDEAENGEIVEEPETKTLDQLAQEQGVKSCHDLDDLAFPGDPTPSDEEEVEVPEARAALVTACEKQDISLDFLEKWCDREVTEWGAREEQKIARRLAKVEAGDDPRKTFDCKEIW